MSDELLARIRSKIAEAEAEPREERGYLSGAAAGLGRGVYGVAESIRGAVNLASDYGLNPTMGARVWGRRYAPLKVPESLRPSPSVEKKIFQPTKAKWWIERGSEVVPQLAAQIGMALGTGGGSTAFGVTAGAMQAGSTYQDTYQRLRKKGYSETKARATAGIEAPIVGTITGVLNKFSGAAYLNKSKAGQKFFEKLLQSRARRISLAGGGEALEEIVTNAAEDSVRYVVENDPGAFKDAFERYLAAGTLGAAAGAGVKGTIDVTLGSQGDTDGSQGDTDGSQGDTDGSQGDTDAAVPPDVVSARSAIGYPIPNEGRADTVTEQFDPDEEFDAEEASPFDLKSEDAGELNPPYVDWSGMGEDYPVPRTRDQVSEPAKPRPKLPETQLLEDLGVWHPDEGDPSQTITSSTLALGEDAESLQGGPIEEDVGRAGQWPSLVEAVASMPDAPSRKQWKDARLPGGRSASERAQAVKQAKAILQERRAQQSTVPEVDNSDTVAESDIQDIQAESQPDPQQVTLPEGRDIDAEFNMLPQAQAAGVPIQDLAPDSVSRAVFAKKQRNWIKEKLLYGHLPRTARIAQERSKGLVDKAMLNAEMLNNDLQNAIKKQNDGNPVTPEQEQAVKAVMEGGTPDESFSTETASAVIRMREMLNGIQQKLKQQGLITKELFEKSEGKWLNRAYRAFTEKKQWTSKFDNPNNPDSMLPEIKEIWDGAVEYLQEVNEVDRDTAAVQAAAILDKATDNPITAWRSVAPRGILKKRKDVPEPIRKLLGEYEKGSQAFLNSVQKATMLLEADKLQQEIRQALIDEGLAQETPREGLREIATSPYTVVEQDGEYYAQWREKPKDKEKEFKTREAAEKHIEKLRSSGIETAKVVERQPKSEANKRRDELTTRAPTKGSKRQADTTVYALKPQSRDKKLAAAKRLKSKWFVEWQTNPIQRKKFDTKEEADQFVMKGGDQGMRQYIGLFTSPEIRTELLEFKPAELVEGWEKLVGGFIAHAKLSATAYTGGGTVRNLGSAMYQAMASTVQHLSSPIAVRNAAWNAVKANVASFRSKRGRSISEPNKSKVLEYVRNGVWDEDVNIGTVKELDKGWDGFATKLENQWAAGKKVLTKPKQFAVDLYVGADNIAKAYRYELEKAAYRKLHPEWSQAQVQKKASDIVRSGMPTYSRLPRALTHLRKGKLIAPFASFATAVPMNLWADVKLGISEMRTPETRMHGAKRLTGLALLAGIVPGMLGMISRAVFGVSDEEAEDVRRLGAPWDENAIYIWGPRGKDGQASAVSLGSVDTWGHMRAVAIAALRGQWKQARWELVEPFIGPELGTQAAIEAVMNEKWSGQRIGSGWDRAAHLGSVAVPGAFKNIRRNIEAAQGKKWFTQEAVNSSVGKEAARWAAGRPVNNDPVRSVFYRSKAFMRDVSDARYRTRRLLLSTAQVSPGSVAAANARADATIKPKLQEMHLDALAAIRLTKNPAEVMKTLRANTSKEWANAIITNRMPTYRPSTSTIKAMRVDRGARLRELQTR